MPPDLDDYTYLESATYFKRGQDYIPFCGIKYTEETESTKNFIEKYIDMGDYNLYPKSPFGLIIVCKNRRMQKFMRTERNRFMRSIRYQKRIREKVRRAKLKGDKCIRIRKPYYLFGVEVNYNAKLV